MKALVIGYGNLLRGDDGVGYQLAETIAALNWQAVRSLAVHQLAPELAAEIAQTEQVYFVDAWKNPKADPWKPCVLPLKANVQSPIGDHCWQPESLLQLAKILYHSEPQAYQVLIPALQFDYCETLSAPTAQGMQWALQMLKSRLASHPFVEPESFKREVTSHA